MSDGVEDTITEEPPYRPRHTGTRRFSLEFPPTMHVGARPAWLIKGLLPSTGLAVLYGRPGSAKSFLALDLALHVAAGRSWAGRRVRQAGVVYVASEGGRGMRRRVLAAIEHHQFSTSLPFALITVVPRLGRQDGDAQVLADDIKAQLPSGFAPGLIVLDTLARSMTGADESGAIGMGVFVESVEILSRELDACVMPIHHSGKDVDRGMRGSSVLLGAADAVWAIAPDCGRLLRVEKMKDAADGLDIPFALREVSLGDDEDGDPVTTLVVDVASVAKPSMASQMLEADETPRPDTSGATAFIENLAAAIEVHGVSVARVRAVPAGAKAVKASALVDYAEIEITASSRKSRQSQINRYLRDLKAAGRIGRHRDHVWVTAGVR